MQQEQQQNKSGGGSSSNSNRNNNKRRSKTQLACPSFPLLAFLLSQKVSLGHTSIDAPPSPGVPVLLTLSWNRRRKSSSSGSGSTAPLSGPKRSPQMDAAWECVPNRRYCKRREI